MTRTVSQSTECPPLLLKHVQRVLVSPSQTAKFCPNTTLLIPNSYPTVSLTETSYHEDLLLESQETEVSMRKQTGGGGKAPALGKQGPAHVEPCLVTRVSSMGMKAAEAGAGKLRTTHMNTECHQG